MGFPFTSSLLAFKKCDWKTITIIASGPCYYPKLKQNMARFFATLGFGI